MDQKEEHEIDFRVPGLSHAVLKEAEHLRVQELVKKIENHPRRVALHADLQQNNIYNPFSKKSKAMIRELGTVELFELCETVPEVQCSHCHLYWNQGIVYCTCGHLLMVPDMARPKNTKSTIWSGMRGRDAVRKSPLKVNISQVFTFDFSKIQFIVNHSSQSDGQKKSAKSGMTFHKKTIHIVALLRK